MHDPNRSKRTTKSGLRVRIGVRVRVRVRVRIGVRVRVRGFASQKRFMMHAT